jgi:putative effector of murein hydrolase LrgA (UPF0299 family)
MHVLRGLAWILLLLLAGEALSRLLRLPFPGPVIGMLLLLGALRWSAVRTSVSSVARFLLSHFSLLFIPVGVGVMTHVATLERFGLRLALVIVLSTWIGLAVTALVLRALVRQDHGGRHSTGRPGGRT